MSSAADTCFRIILGKSEAVLQEPIAKITAEIFAISESMALKVVKAAPIAILTRLDLAQGSCLLQALQPLREAGATLSLETGGDRLTNQVSWPSPPKIFGTLATEMLANGSIVCPACGAGLMVQLAPAPSSTTGGHVPPKPKPKTAKPPTSGPPSSIAPLSQAETATGKKTSVRKVVRKPTSAGDSSVITRPAKTKPAPAPQPIPVDDEEEGDDSLFGGLEPLSDSGPVSWAESPPDIDKEK